MARPVERLPSLFVQLVGEVTNSNLAAYRETAIAVISSINTTLVTDVDFATAEQHVKFCDAGERELELVKKQALAQTATIDELFKTIDELKEHLRTKRLELEKLVKVRKESIRIEIVTAAKNKYASHVADLNKRIGTSYLAVQYPDFASAIKGKKNISSLHDACDTLLAQSKIAANAVADTIQGNINIKEVREFNFLFSDLSVLCTKSMEDFQSVVSNRVHEHQAKEAARIAAETARIAEQERIKAEAKAAYELAAAREADRVAEQKRLQDAAKVAAEFAAAETAKARAAAVSALAEIKAASPVFLAEPVVSQPVVCEAWSAAVSPTTDYAPTIHVHRQRAATRAMVDNVLDTLSESDMQYLLNYLQTTFVKQAA